MEQLDRGVGYLVHNSPQYAEYVEAVGAGAADLYEVLFGHYAARPEEIRRIMAYGRPIVIHATALSIASDAAVWQRNVGKLEDLARRCEALWIGDHLCFMEDAQRGAGGLLPPLMTEEQLATVLANLAAARAQLSVPLILENVNMHYAIGPLPFAAFVAELLARCDVRLSVSLENLSQSCEYYIPVPHRAYIDTLPRDRVTQIHCTLANEIAARANPRIEKRRRLHLELLEWMAAEGFRPQGVIFELEAGLDTLCEPQELRERLQWARELFGLAAAPPPAPHRLAVPA